MSNIIAVKWLFLQKNEKLFLTAAYTNSITPGIWYSSYINVQICGVRRGRDHMVIGFTTTCAISAYRH